MKKKNIELQAQTINLIKIELHLLIKFTRKSLADLFLTNG